MQFFEATLDCVEKLRKGNTRESRLVTKQGTGYSSA
jgi:hypothetical protein